MNIVITGASGFIGEELIAAAQSNTSDRFLLLSRSSIQDGQSSDAFEWKQTDYSEDNLTDLFTAFHADTVIHLAAVRGTDGKISDYHINEILTENVLAAMRNAGTRRIVLASTIAVYSDTSAIPWTEGMPLSPKTLYGISKAACEHLCMYYAHACGFSYSIVRIAQVLGTGEQRRGMMNVFIDLARQQKQLRVMGRSEARRQYLYVRDLADILLSLARDVSGQSFVLNAGMSEAYTNLEIAQTINEVFSNDTPINYESDYPERIEASEMDIRPLLRLLGHEPLSLRDALIDIRRELELNE